jgi:lipopolysaccharide transport system permease protein
MRNPVTLPHIRQPLYIYDLLRELVVRDMKLRYKRSVLGIVWSLLNPFSQMLIFIFLSRRVLSLDITSAELLESGGCINAPYQPANVRGILRGII